MKVHVEYRFQVHGYAVFFYDDAGEVRRFRLPNEVIREVRQGECIEDLVPTFMLYDDDSQNLIEALTHCGVQPKHLTLVEGQFQAQSEHLKDLQKILRKQRIME